MSIARDIAVFFLSAIFTFTLFTTVISYTMSSKIQKENIKDFIKSQLSSGLANQQCETYCKDYTETKERCMEMCLAELYNKTDETISKSIDEVYNKEIFSVKINTITYFISQFPLFFVLSIASGVFLLFVSKTPIVSLGKSFISVSIGLLITSFSPDFLLLSSNLPLVQSIFDYLSLAFKQQMNFGIIFLIIGIALLATGYFLKFRKLKASKK